MSPKTDDRTLFWKRFVQRDRSRISNVRSLLDHYHFSFNRLHCGLCLNEWTIKKVNIQRVVCIDILMKFSYLICYSFSNIKYSIKELSYLFNTILSTIHLMKKYIYMPKNFSASVNENKGKVLTSYCGSSEGKKCLDQYFK